MKKITSINNPQIKHLISLEQKSSYRKRSNLFVVEGIREIGLAVEGGYEFSQVFFCDEIFKDKDFLSRIQADEFIMISKELYRRIAYRGTTEGVIAVGKVKKNNLERLKINKSDPIFLIAEGIEKPGNIGAILRTVDASGIDGVILSDLKTDLYNPNIIRSSVGTVFTVNIAVSSTVELIDYLARHKIRLYAATLQTNNIYYKEEFRGAVAIAVGSEDKGLSVAIRKAAYKQIVIPMRGKIDSMNVSVSAAVLVFEAMRQRSLLT